MNYFYDLPPYFLFRCQRSDLEESARAQKADSGIHKQEVFREVIRLFFENGLLVLNFCWSICALPAIVRNDGRKRAIAAISLHGAAAKHRKSDCPRGICDRNYGNSWRK